MFDCFCPQTFEWEQPTAVPAPALCENVPRETFPNQRPTAVTDDPPWWLALETFVAEFLHRLHMWWALCGAYLRWYALLSSTVEALLLGLSMLPQSSWKHRLQWRRLRYVPEYLRINFALVVSVLTIYANLAAITGVLMDDGAGQRSYLLLPYIVLNVLRLTVEFSHLLADQLAAPPTLPDHGEVNPPKSLVLLQSCNLSIMMAVYFDVVPRSGASSLSTESVLQALHAWYRGFQKPHAKVS